MYVGRHVGVLGKIVEVNSNKHFAKESAGSFPFGKRFMAVIGEMAFVLESGLPPGPDVHPPCVAPNACFEMLSGRTESLAWPPPGHVGYSDFFGLFHAPVGIERDMRVVGLMMDRSPEIREGEEAQMLANLAARKTQPGKGTRPAAKQKGAAKAARS